MFAGVLGQLWIHQVLSKCLYFYSFLFNIERGYYKLWLLFKSRILLLEGEAGGVSQQYP